MQTHSLEESRKRNVRRNVRKHVSLLKVKDLLKELMANVVHLAKKDKQKEAEIEFAQEQKKVMLIAQDLQELKNVKTRHVQTHYLEKSGNVVAKNRWLKNENINQNS